MPNSDLIIRCDDAGSEGRLLTRPSSLRQRAVGPSARPGSGTEGLVLHRSAATMLCCRCRKAGISVAAAWYTGARLEVLQPRRRPRCRQFHQDHAWERVGGDRDAAVAKHVEHPVVLG